MFRFPLRWKFGTLLACFAVAISAIIVLNFRTYRYVASQLDQVRTEAFPQLSEAVALVASFEEVMGLFTDAAILGADILLEDCEEEREQFRWHLKKLTIMTPPHLRAELEGLGRLYEEYFESAQKLANYYVLCADPDNDLELWCKEPAASPDLVTGLTERVRIGVDGLLNEKHRQVDLSLSRSGASIQKQAQRAMAIGTASFGVMMAFLLFLTRRIVSPIKSLSRMTAEVAQGNFDQEADNSYSAKDEVGDLWASFQTMTQGLRETTVSKDYLDNILKSMQDVLIVLNEDGKVRTFNKAALSILGYEVEELIGASIGDILLEEQKVNSGKSGIDGLIDESVGSEEKTFLTKNGKRIPVSFSRSALMEDGKLRGVVCVAQDITERKQAEQALIQAKQETEHTNLQLEKAIEHANRLAAEADRANETKSEFLANMSHEIRTPMNGVIGMTGLLLDTDLTPDQSEYAETIRKSGDALLGIINDILDFSKIEAGKLNLEPIDFNLRLALEEATDLLVVRANEKGLEFICMIEPEVPSLLQGDPGRLRQVVVNLLGNAVKFTSEGEVAIRVSLEREDQESAMVRFAVTDTGIGIPEEQWDTLFDSFTQADGSTTRRFGGTGLGLSISKKIVEMMGGEIGLQSAAGQGSTFWFTIVLGKQPPGLEPSEDPARDISGEHVLIVDDNATNRRFLSILLDSWDCTHDEASGGPVALEKLRAAADQGEPFRIALVDMHMPGMDGEMLGAEIRKDPALQGTLLVMLTSLGYRGDAARLREVGYCGYLTKPIRQGLLHDTMVTVLSGKDNLPLPAGQVMVTRHTVTEEKLRKVRILLAEDDITNQQVALGILGKLGYRADAVANGHEAVEALKRAPYDLVLMDVQMPEMDGFEATRIVRDKGSQVLNHDIPIIAMTAHAIQGDRERCLDAGMDDYVTKPVHPQILRKAIEVWFNKKGSIRPEETSAVKDTAAELEAFTLDGLLDRLMGDEKLMQKVIDGFLQNAPRRIDAIKKALDKADAVMVKLQAHSLKGACANVGATALEEAALEMEMAGDAGDLAHAASLVARIDEQSEVLIEALARLGE